MVKLNVTNSGKGAVENGLANLMVPFECEIEAKDHDHKQHFTATLPMLSNIDDEGSDEPSAVRYTVAYDTFLPGVDYYFHALVTLPGKGDYRVSGVVVGESPDGRRVHERTSFTVRF
jgi:hypothetical protein